MTDILFVCIELTTKNILPKSFDCVFVLFFNFLSYRSYPFIYFKFLKIQHTDTPGCVYH